MIKLAVHGHGKMARVLTEEVLKDPELIHVNLGFAMGMWLSSYQIKRADKDFWELAQVADRAMGIAKDSLDNADKASNIAGRCAETVESAPAT